MRNWINILIGLICFTIGINFTISLFVYDSYTISNKIDLSVNPLEIISLLINVSLAIYVTSVLAKSQDANKAHREISINFLQEYRVKLTENVYQILQSSNFSSASVIGDLSNLRKRWAATQKILKAADLGISDADFLSISRDIRGIWQVITSVPTNFPNNQAFTPAQRAQVISSAELLLLAAELKLFNMIFQINRK